MFFESIIFFHYQVAFQQGLDLCRCHSLYVFNCIVRQDLEDLVAVRKTTHARHDTEDIVVHGIHAEVERR